MNFRKMWIDIRKVYLFVFGRALELEQYDLMIIKGKERK